MAPGKNVLERVLRAHEAGEERLLIATASIEGDELVVWSCEPKEYRCPVSEFPPLARLPKSQLSKFEISSSGSRLHWDSGDVDLTLDAILAVADPEVRDAQERQYRHAAKAYAEAIRVVRQRHGLSQADVKGLSDRAVRRIERGERIPHSSTLKKLATAHGMPVDAYMRALAKASASAKAAKGKRKRRSDA